MNSELTKKESKKIQLPKDKIIHVGDVVGRTKDTPTMVPRQQLLMAHNRRKVYVPMSNLYPVGSSGLRIIKKGGLN